MNRVDSNVATVLLRDPAAIARAILEGRRIRAIAITSILAVAIGTIAYGGVVGSVRGGAQIAYAAVKMPLVSLLTLSLVAPFVAGLATSFGRPIGLARAVAIVLAQSARAALVLLAFAPIVALLLVLTPSYHEEVLYAAAGFGLAGLAGLGVLRNAIADGEGAWTMRALVVVGFVLVSAQCAWVLRPWVSRPSSPLAFVRAPEGMVTEELARSAASASGHYDEARSARRAQERARLRGGPR